MQDGLLKWPPSMCKPVEICFPTYSMQYSIHSSTEKDGRSHPDMASGPSLELQAETVPFVPFDDCNNHVVVEQNSTADQVVDLNSTLQQKPKRKKIRPKVIKEGNSARVPKSAPKPTTTLNQKDNEVGSSGKRKYTRRKVVNSPIDSSVEKPSGKRKYVRKKVANTPVDVPAESSSSKRKYVRKKVDPQLAGAADPHEKHEIDVNLHAFEILSSCNQGLANANPSFTNATDSYRMHAQSVRRSLNFEAEGTQSGVPPRSSLTCSSNVINQGRQSSSLGTSACSIFDSGGFELRSSEAVLDSIPKDGTLDSNILDDQMPNKSILRSNIYAQTSQRPRGRLNSYMIELNSRVPHNSVDCSNNSVSQMRSVTDSFPEYFIPVPQLASRHTEGRFKILDGSFMAENSEWIQNEHTVDNGFVQTGINHGGHAKSSACRNEFLNVSYTPSEGIKRDQTFANDANISIGTSYNYTMSQQLSFPNSCKRVRTERTSLRDRLLGLPSSHLSTAHSSDIASLRCLSGSSQVYTLAEAQMLVAHQTQRLHGSKDMVPVEMMKQNGVERSQLLDRPYDASCRLPGKFHSGHAKFRTSPVNSQTWNDILPHPAGSNHPDRSNPPCHPYRTCSMNLTNCIDFAPDRHLRFPHPQHHTLPTASLPLQRINQVPLESTNKHYAQKLNSLVHSSCTFLNGLANNGHCAAFQIQSGRAPSEQGKLPSTSTGLQNGTRLANGVAHYYASKKDIHGKISEQPIPIRGSKNEKADVIINTLQLNSGDSLNNRDILDNVQDCTEFSLATVPYDGKDRSISNHTASLSRKMKSKILTKQRSSKVKSSGVTEQLKDQLDNIIQKLCYLDISRERETVVDEAQHAIVPYEGGYGTMVQYKGKLKPIRKRQPRARVNIDPVTNTMWNLLMGIDPSDATECMDKDKEKWLEEERAIFRGRVDSFIARMHLVQGDRRFSRWKGSVVDSVVGVFLTQNVSDHLSSSAFMCLAAKYPVKLGQSNEKPANGTVYPCSLEKGFPNPDGILGGSLKLEVKLSVNENSDFGSLLTSEEKEGSNSNESFGSNSGEGTSYPTKRGSIFGEKVGKSVHSSGENQYPTTESAVGTEAEERTLEDVVSSQDSVISSQNSPDYRYQVPDHVGSNMCAASEFTGSYTELLRRAELQCQSSGRVGLHSYQEANVHPTSGEESRFSFLHAMQELDGKSILETSFLKLLNDHNDYPGVQCVYPSENLPKQDGFTLLHSESDHWPLPASCISGNGIATDTSSSVTCQVDELECQKSLCSSQHSEEAHPLSAFTKQGIQPSNVSVANYNSEAFKSHTALLKSVSEVASEPICLNGLQDRRIILGIHSGKEETELVSTKACASTKGQLYEDKQLTSSEVLPVTQNVVDKSFGYDVGSSGVRHNHTNEHLPIKQPVGSYRSAVATEHHELTIPGQLKDTSCKSGFNTDCKQRPTPEVLNEITPSLLDKSSVQTSSSEVVNIEMKVNKKRGTRSKRKRNDWDSLRKEVCSDGVRARSFDALDSLDYEALRRATVQELSETIRERGMNNLLAERIKEFLDRLVSEHGSTDLEWLRDVDPDKAKDYLLSIRGLGLKSVECVRLLTLHHLAFPVDTNVGRICVRLGWVPLQPLPESLQLHLLELYPVLENIQKYLWPRLCKLDQRTLYELHYQMITFGKVFCTKSKPNCNSCPMRAECKHFASAFASARLALPAPEERSLVSSAANFTFKNANDVNINAKSSNQLEWNDLRQQTHSLNCEPVIEEPATPEPEVEEAAIEDAFLEDPDEIPTIKLNFEEFTQNLKSYMQANNVEIEEANMSKALVAITPEAASIPVPKLKNINRLRTEHRVYELPDSHPLLEGFERREADDPCPYLLSIWTPGETAQSTNEPKSSCDLQGTGKLCDNMTCFSCNSIRETQAHKVRGTLLIPCRTAMRGSFPLNGTYFQVNEVFADHDSSRVPIDVPRSWIWNLPRRTVYFGTSIPTIFKGLTTEEIQHCFWRGFVCVRGFDRATRAPRPLYARLHFPASKSKARKSAALGAARAEQP